ncbi:MAG: phosphoribosylformylglycinamidine synthase [Lachnospiraceae bacterium]|nr:phosphoribosylformylglycinamidine synthase [Lachnospiraceae bacterium]
MVKRVYVEKKSPYAVRARELEDEIRDYIGIKKKVSVRYLLRYDIENVDDEIYEKAKVSVFSEPPVDFLYEEDFPHDEKDHVFAVEYLPGQFDQRADSAEQCIGFLSGSGKKASLQDSAEALSPIIRTAEVYCLKGRVTKEEMKRIRSYVMNPVDSRVAAADKPETLIMKYEDPEDVKVMEGLTGLTYANLKKVYATLGLAMTFEDFKHVQKYFLSERRDPTITEIRVLDTYWSDHCRHTTFQTELTDISFRNSFYREPIENAYKAYLKARDSVYGDRVSEKGGDKFVCLMDIATMGMRALKKAGKLEDLEKSDEINACSIVVPIHIVRDDGTEETENWLVMFKNETHNHPTEIEPFGGAATCLGGAIRDPLSGRAYVYQAMRITGAGDPTVNVSDTLPGKLPQKKLVRGAAHGYSSYGNQIGLATGLVREIYNPKYVAKRMEIGAVMGAAPQKNVVREHADPGDVVILLGGRTGRDGIGGATGSSKVHTSSSIDTCGAEVQKGNAPTERKLQRLFRRPEVSLLIKVCNDFGAGGVSVAIGELADGLEVNLDLVPKKYAGLDGTELAISESQERMAVVVAAKDEEKFLSYAAEENLEATRVALVTEEPRLVLKWRGKTVVNLSRAFLNTNGAHQKARVIAEPPTDDGNVFWKFRNVSAGKIEDTWLNTLSDLNVCSQKGLVEMFDSTIGAGTVTMPFGGKYQMTPNQTMIAKLPILNGTSDAVTMMSWGFEPEVSIWSPYHGAIYAVTDSIAKIIASGGEMDTIRFTFQEYFKRLKKRETFWGEPFMALLGAFDAEMGYGLPSIGGKDSMSGTFERIHVPPTLVSFAINVASIQNVVTPEFKSPGNSIVKFEIPLNEYHLPVYEGVKELYHGIEKLVKKGLIRAAYALDEYGIAAALSKMAFGNGFGVKVDDSLKGGDLFASEIGNILAEVSDIEALKSEGLPFKVIGKVSEEKSFVYGDTVIPYEKALNAYTSRLEQVFPTKASQSEEKLDIPIFHSPQVHVCRNKVAKPKVFIPVFPGTNCEFDSAAAFKRAGADTEVLVFRNQNEQEILDSVEAFSKAIGDAQIIMFPGGFSAGDEPDGSAKFFATAFRNEAISEAVRDLIEKRDGLVLGICNGFQALIKLGLVPYGQIIDAQKDDSPTLTFNTINRHISRMAYTKVVSNKSPWLINAEPGKTYVNPASHGEGRFVAPEEWIQKLFQNGQVATVYADPEGQVSMDEEWNINGSYSSIEGITSEDGRIYGKMCHAERRGDGICINIFGDQDMKLFESGVEYFK